MSAYDLFVTDAMVCIPPKAGRSHPRVHTTRAVGSDPPHRTVSPIPVRGQRTPLRTTLLSRVWMAADTIAGWGATLSGGSLTCGCAHMSNASATSPVAVVTKVQ